MNLIKKLSRMSLYYAFIQLLYSVLIFSNLGFSYDAAESAVPDKKSMGKSASLASENADKMPSIDISKESPNHNKMTDDMLKENLPENAINHTSPIEHSDKPSQIPLDKEFQDRKIGPRTIPGLILKDVKSDGNCFYWAVLHQMVMLDHSFLDVLGEKINWCKNLRRFIQEDSQEGQWANDITFYKLVEKIDLILGIIDTGTPEAGYTYYYKGESGTFTHVPDEPNPLPNKPIIRLAATGDHFLSVVSGAYDEKPKKEIKVRRFNGALLDEDLFDERHPSGLNLAKVFTMMQLERREEIVNSFSVTVYNYIMNQIKIDEFKIDIESLQKELIEKNQKISSKENAKDQRKSRVIRNEIIKLTKESEVLEKQILRSALPNTIIGLYEVREEQRRKFAEVGITIKQLNSFPLTHKEFRNAANLWLENYGIPRADFNDYQVAILIQSLSKLLKLS